ncbi:MAG: hypothetical protein LBJ21_09750 [Acidobacteriota bacterium]|jgi:hypothetical protein|nr:hypothetical protein [Acidobacteriota bacterium]
MQECHRRKNRKNQQLISRRDFAKGSAAVMGAYAVADAVAALDEPSGKAKSVKIEKSAEITALMDERHITDDDIRNVIAYAEETGRKLYKQNSDHFLSKRRMGQTYFYVEYSPAGESAYKIHAAWAHRFVILKEPY